MAKSAPFQVVVHKPENAEGMQELARRAAWVHADYVIASIQKLDCPTEQKLKLLDAVIAASKKRL